MCVRPLLDCRCFFVEKRNMVGDVHGIATASVPSFFSFLLATIDAGLVGVCDAALSARLCFRFLVCLLIIVDVSTCLVLSSSLSVTVSLSSGPLSRLSPPRLPDPRPDARLHCCPALRLFFSRCTAAFFGFCTFFCHACFLCFFFCVCVSMTIFLLPPCFLCVCVCVGRCAVVQHDVAAFREGVPP